jgi:hypothetical protein
MKARLFLMLLSAVLAGCAPRTLPPRFPTASPASPQSPEAPKARVVTTLQSDPPLPGEPDGDWRGLEQAPASSKHSHQEH